MKDVNNPSLAVGRGSLLNCPRPSFLDFKFEIPFQLPSAVYLLISILAVICQSYSITNRTVSNEMVKSLTYFGVI